MQGLYMLRFTEIKEQEKVRLKEEKLLEKVRLKEEKSALKKQKKIDRNAKIAAQKESKKKSGVKIKDVEEDDQDFIQW